MLENIHEAKLLQPMSSRAGSFDLLRHYMTSLAGIDQLFCSFANKMSEKYMHRMTDKDIDILISLWHDEPQLWDSNLATYYNADLRKAALKRIAAKLDGMDTGTTNTSYTEVVLKCLQY